MEEYDEEEETKIEVSSYQRLKSRLFNWIKTNVGFEQSKSFLLERKSSAPAN